MDRNVEELLFEIQAATEDFGLHSLSKTLQRVRNFAEQNRYLDVAVMGQFKAGKSSFINSLLGQNLLPVGSIPVTSVITRISYGPQPKAQVTFEDGSIREIPCAAVHEYITEAENPENYKNVVLVDITVPEMEKIKNIRLIDTPGLGSVWKHNTETTIGWFPETGAVLYVTSAEKPLAEHDLDVLQDIAMYSPEVALVITKVDLFKEHELKEVEDFSNRVLERTFEREIPIFRYSVYDNTGVYREQIYERVFKVLAENREESFARILRHKINTVTDNCISYLEMSYQASMRRDAERRKLKEIILDQHLNSQFVRRELQLIVSSYKSKTRENLWNYLESYRSSITARLLQKYDCAFAGWRGNLYQLTRHYENWLRDALGLELKELLVNDEKSFELINAVKKHLSFYLKSFRERLNDNLTRVLGIQMHPEQWEIAAGTMKKPDINISRAFDSHLDLLWFLFPMVIFRNAFCSYFRKQIPHEVEKNLHRLTSGLTERVNREIDNLMNQALAYINEELNTVENLLSGSKEESKEVLERIKRIKAKYEII